MARDERAFRRVVEVAMLAASIVTLVALLLGPIGGVAHLSGIVSAACLSLPHLASDLAAVLLAGLVLSSIVGATGSIVLMVLVRRQIRQVERAHARPSAQARADLVAAALGISAPVVVVAHEDLRAWSSGLFASMIYLSEPVVDVLDDHELGAVLMHEEHHCRRRDPLRLFVAAAIERSLRAFPVVAPSVVEFRRATEFEADDRARAAVGAVATARAILRFAHVPARPMLAQVHGAHVAERVERLLGTDPAPAPPVRRSIAVSVAVAIVSLGCLVVVGTLPGM